MNAGVDFDVSSFMKRPPRKALPLPLSPPSATSTKWFSDNGCVVVHGERWSVLVGGMLISQFDKENLGLRNMILVMLANDAKVHLGRLAKAFGLSRPGLDLIRKVFAEGGMRAVLERRPKGRPRIVTAPIKARMEKLFAVGKSVDEVHVLIQRTRKMSPATVSRAHREWLAARVSAPAPVVEAPQQRALPFPVGAEATPESATSPSSVAVVDSTPRHATVEAPLPVVAPEATLAEAPSIRAPREESSRVQLAAPQELARLPGAGVVQHLGTWLVIAMVARLGLHEAADALRGTRVKASPLRIAIDAVIAALAIGERCVEGVRRLATGTGAALLLARASPSASWVRQILGRFANDDGAMRLHLKLAGTYLKEACAEDGNGAPAVFYVDNHTRPYTGAKRLLHGWRMQDKRAVPGNSDYYVHDEDGRPVLRGTVPSHGSLSSFLLPLAVLMRVALGRTERFLLAFDRGGAFPKPMAELRAADVDFVTYERAPFRRLPRNAFTKCELDGEELWLCEAQANLGAGRGRVRRIWILLPNGKQLSLLAISELPAERLVQIMRGRWRQENGFKHGVERWGINQLDGRTTAPYPEGTIIPNPARRRLERALTIAQAREGEARRKLAKAFKESPAGARRKAELKLELTRAMELQRQLEAQRPAIPDHAPVEETILAGELVHHTGEYKMTIDTLRIACANSESVLATELACYLPRPDEAKRALRNLFLSPGTVKVTANMITVNLCPAGTRAERHAYEALLATVNEWGLTHPGDVQARKLKFECQLH